MKKIIAVIMFLVIGILIPYLVQFKLNMLGSNFVTIKHIMGLWVMCLGAGFFAALIYSYKH